MGTVETDQVACPRCGAGFRRRRPGQLYCSERCQRNAGISRTKRRRRTRQTTVAALERESCCRNCGGKLPSARLFYCSEICRSRVGSKRRHPPIGPPLPFPVPCITCGTLFARATYTHRFCSVECRPSWTPPRPRPAPVPRPAPPPPSPRSCVTCGRPFLRLDRRGYRNACSYRCELDRQNAKAAEQRRTAGWREREHARRSRRQQENDAIFTAVRELGWLDGLLEAVK